MPPSLPPTAAGPGAIHPLLEPLGFEREVTVTSDQVHAAEVQGKLPAPTSKPSKTTLTEVDEVHGVQHVSPAEILLELAEVSTPAVLTQGMRNLSLRWAWLHYCWAFEDVPRPPPTKKMLLSSAARRLAQHRKQVASDDLGVGFGLVLARRALETRFSPAITKAFDAEEIIKANALAAWGIDHTGPLLPDYFIQVSSLAGGKPWSSIWVLECKGTQGTGHLDQIRKGVTQTATITHASTGSPAPAIVSATAFSASRTRVRLVDPPGDRDDPWAGTETAESDAGVRRTNKKPVVDRLEVFRHELAQLDLSATLAFAGLYARAAEFAPERLRREAPARDGMVDAQLTPAGRADSASGVQAELPLIGGRTIRATCAVDNRVLDAARKGSVRDIRVARGLVAKDLSGREDAMSARRRSLVEFDASGLLRVTARTGLVIEIAVN
ncbi:MAG: hypothetical protein WAU77_10765 [Solirubrobacteraceae bacterium]